MWRRIKMVEGVRKLMNTEVVKGKEFGKSVKWEAGSIRKMKDWTNTGRLGKTKS